MTVAGASATPGEWSVASTRTTVSAPSGIGAPVMIRHAAPGRHSRGTASPAGMSPATGSATGAASPAMSSKRRAKPSMAEFVKGGTGTAARTSSARTAPAHDSSGASTAGSGWASASTRSRCSGMVSSGSRMGTFYERRPQTVSRTFVAERWSMAA